MHTRIGTPDAFAGVPDVLEAVPYSAALGLVRKAASEASVTWSRRSEQANASYIGQVGRWFRESFWDDEREQRLTGS